MIVVLAISALYTTLPITQCQDIFTFENGVQLFTSLDDLLSYFKNQSNPLARQILESFERDCKYVHEPSFTERTRKPFIVILGNHRATREVVGMRLAQRLTGRYMGYPAPCLDRYTSLLPKGTLLRKAFYFLSNYASAYYAKIQLSLNKAVVLNGYYYEQMVFTIVNSFTAEQMPAITSDLFKFPEDLLKPNLAIFIDYTDDMMYRYQQSTRYPLHWKPRTVSTYRMLQERYPLIVQEACRLNSETASLLYKYIRKNLYHVNGTWHHNRYNESIVDTTYNIQSIYHMPVH